MEVTADLERFLRANASLVLMFRAECSCFTSKSAHVSANLPQTRQQTQGQRDQQYVQAGPVRESRTVAAQYVAAESLCLKLEQDLAAARLNRAPGAELARLKRQLDQEQSRRASLVDELAKARVEERRRQRQQGQEQRPTTARTAQGEQQQHASSRANTPSQQHIEAERQRWSRELRSEAVRAQSEADRIALRVRTLERGNAWPERINPVRAELAQADQQARDARDRWVRFENERSEQREAQITGLRDSQTAAVERAASVRERLEVNNEQLRQLLEDRQVIQNTVGNAQRSAWQLAQEAQQARLQLQQEQHRIQGYAKADRAVVQQERIAEQAQNEARRLEQEAQRHEAKLREVTQQNERLTHEFEQTVEGVEANRAAIETEKRILEQQMQDRELRDPQRRPEPPDPRRAMEQTQQLHEVGPGFV